MSLIDSILQAGQGTSTADPNFPHAPDGWTVAAACQLARQDGLTVTEEHWEVVRALQEYLLNPTKPEN